MLAFCDVEGNDFTVLAYRYTTVLSAQLINFWSIVIVVVISFVVLKVPYKFIQHAGFVIPVGGMGVLLASDHIGTKVLHLKMHWMMPLHFVLSSLAC